MEQHPVHAKILSEFDEHRAAYEYYARTVAALVEQILLASNIVVHSITWRCKQRDSLAQKLQKASKPYAEIKDITDVAAMRITTYFSDDVDRVAKIIESEFRVDDGNSVDKRMALDPDRFGYQSLHYVASLSEVRAKLIENFKFKGLKIEIQIRSILQHAWAEIEHDIGYKSARGVPRDVRRRFARVAGLLELADAEFASIREQLADYAASVVSEIQDDPAKVELDLVSLRALYTFDSNCSRLDHVVAELMDRDLVSRPEHIREAYVERLAKLDIYRVDELESVAARERATLSKFAKYWLARPSMGDGWEHGEPVDAGIGLFYLIYVLLWRAKDRTAALEYFQSNNIGIETDKEPLVDDLMNFTG